MRLHRRRLGRHSAFVSVISVIGCFGLTTASVAQEADDRGPSGTSRSARGADAVRGLAVNDPIATRNLRQSLVVDGRDVVGESGQRIPLGLSIRRQNDITIESIKLLGLPAGYILRDSLRTLKSDDIGQNLDVTDWNIAGLWIEQPERRSEQFWLSLILVWKLKSSESIEISVTDFAVEVGQNSEAERNSEAGRNSEMPAISRAPAPASSNRVDVAGKPVQAAASVNGAAVERRPGERARPVEVGARRPAPDPPPSARATDTRSSVARARDLIGRGDISGARLLLERGRARNEPDATFLLAQTWDPKMLRQWNVRGLRPDPERARALYDEAAKPEPADEPQMSVTRR